MGQSGLLRDWSLFLDARTEDEAIAALAKHVGRLDGVYEDLRAAMSPLWSAPEPEIGETLRVARTTMAEAIGMLEFVQARFRAAIRESA